MINNKLLIVVLFVLLIALIIFFFLKFINIKLESSAVDVNKFFDKKANSLEIYDSDRKTNNTTISN